MDKKKSRKIKTKFAKNNPKKPEWLQIRDI